MNEWFSSYLHYGSWMLIKNDDVQKWWVQKHETDAHLRNFDVCFSFEIIQTILCISVFLLELTIIVAKIPALQFISSHDIGD